MDMTTEARTADAAPPPFPRREPVAAGKDRPGGSKAVWRFNVPLLLWTFVIVAVAAPAIHFWRNFQIDRQASAIFDRAQTLHDEGKSAQAASTYHKYLQLRPNDERAIVARALDFAKAANRQSQFERAISFLFLAVLADGTNSDVRFELAKLLYGNIYPRRLKEAEEQARAVVEARPDDIEAARLLVAAQLAQLTPGQIDKKLPQVIRAFQAALEKHPGDIELSAGFARLLRERRDLITEDLVKNPYADADDTIAKMVETHPHDAAALLAAYNYHRSFKPASAPQTADAQQVANADAFLQRAKEAAPDDPDVLLSLAVQASDTDREAAAGYVRRLLEIRPEDRRVYLTGASFYAAWQQPDEAIATLRSGLEKVDADDLEMIQALLRLLLDKGDVAESRQVLERFKPLLRRASPYMDEALRRLMAERLALSKAHLKLLEGKPESAIPALKTLATSVAEGGDAASTLAARKRRMRLLATAYSAAGMHAPAAATLEELLRLEPLSSEIKLAAASELRQSGQPDRANQFEEEAARDSTAPGAWLELTQARLVRELQKKEDARDWKSVKQSLQNARRRVGEAPPVMLLEAAISLGRGREEEAAGWLDKLLATDGIDREMLPRIALLLNSAGVKDRADQTLALYRSQMGDPMTADLVQCELLRRRGDPAAALKLLEESIESQTSEASRERGLRRLTSLEIELAEFEAARRHLAELRKIKSDDLSAYMVSADLALLSGDLDEVRTYEDELQQQEGSSGKQWRLVRALRLLEEQNDAARPKLNEAQELLHEIEALNPTWPQANILRGRIAEFQKPPRSADAVTHYEAALRQGAGNMLTLQRLVANLYRLERPQEAAAWIRQAGQISTSSRELAALTIPASVRTGNFDAATKMARASAELRRKDPMAQLAYAETLALAKQPEDAERVFRKALQLAPKDPGIWRALIRFFVREGRVEEGRKMSQEMLVKIELTPHEQLLMQARNSTVLGDRDAAEQFYDKALEEHEKDLRLQEEVGRFYFRFNHDKAREHYQAALKTDSQSIEARRALAVLEGLSGTEAGLKNALELLKGGDQSSIDNLRLQAALLLSSRGEQPTELREKAVKLAKTIVDKQTEPLPIDRILLTRALENVDQFDEARNQYELLLADHDTATFVLAFVEFLLRQKDLVEADARLAPIEKSEPANSRAMQLRAEWLRQSDKAADIPALVDRFVAASLESAKGDAEIVATYRLAADLLTREKDFAGAERLLRDLSARVASSYEIHAIWMARQNRADEAVALCLDKRGDFPGPDGLLPLVRVLTLVASQTPETKAEAGAAEGALAAATSSADATPQFLLELGVLRVMQGRDADAIALYDLALEKDPQNVAVLNNRALALADEPGRREQAIADIEKAVAAIPNNAELLDTRALVLLGVGRVEESREILENLCARNTANSRYYLHLAMACHRLNDNARAKELVQQARAGLEGEILTPAERRFLNQFEESDRAQANQ